MLAFLETGTALYLLSAVCLLGIFSRLVTDNLYKRLTRETERLLTASRTAANTIIKNKRMKSLKQNAEATFRINHGMGSTRAFLEHQVQSLRLFKVPLASWDRFANRMTLLCFFLGGVGSFMSYWYRCDTYYIVLYGSVGILTGLFTLLPDAGAGSGDHRLQLLNALEDYLENCLFAGMGPAPVREAAPAREGAAGARPGAMYREVSRMEAHAEEMAPTEEPRAQVRGHASIRKKDRVGKKSLTPVPNLTPVEKDADSVKRSLEQIAASRERHKTEDENWVQNLTPDEVRLIGDIIKEYLA